MDSSEKSFEDQVPGEPTIKVTITRTLLTTALASDPSRREVDEWRLT